MTTKHETQSQELTQAEMEGLGQLRLFTENDFTQALPASNQLRLATTVELSLPGQAASKTSTERR
jgi:hypothetical protein